MELEIINNEVVTTTTQPLEDYISQKKQELDMIGQEELAFRARKESILSELESLV